MFPFASLVYCKKKVCTFLINPVLLVLLSRIYIYHYRSDSLENIKVSS